MSGLIGSLQNTGKNIATVAKGIVGQAGSQHINNNSKLFMGNLLWTTACAAALSRNSGDDINATQSIAQDVIVNGNILLESVNNPTELFKKSITETTVFATLVGLGLPFATSQFKSTPFDMACGAVLPFLSDGMSHVVTKIASMMSSNTETTPEEKTAETKKTKEKEETKEETKEEKEKKEKNLYKTYGAVGFAGLLKAGVLVNNILQGNGHTSNAIYAASLVNTLKTGYDTRHSFNNGENIRDSKLVSGIVLDGVVSPLMTIAVLGLSQRLNLPNTVASTIGKAIVGGVLASGALKGVTYGLDKVLEHYFTKDDTQTPKTQ